MAGPWEKYQTAEDGPWAKYATDSQADATPQMTRGEFIKRELMRSPPVAVARGVKDLLDTGAQGAAWLYDKATGADKPTLSSLVTGQPQGEAARVAAMNKAGRAEFDQAAEGQFLPQAARFTGNMAAAGPLVKGAGALVGTVAPRLGAAIGSSGMTTGAAPVGMAAKAGDLAIRSAGGGAAGALAAGAVNPDDAGVGGAIGAALPGGTAAAGAAGRWLGSTRAGQAVADAFRSGGEKAARQILTQLGMDGRADELVQYLRAAPSFVPGSKPTLAQALVGTPAQDRAAIYERVVSKTPGGARLLDSYTAQSNARMAALEGVAPTNPLGLAQSKEDFGGAIASYAGQQRKAAKAATRQAYESVPQDEAALYLPDLAAARNKYFPDGSFANRGAVDQAVSEAGRIGQISAPGILPTKAGAAPTTLAQAVRKAGGLNMARNDGRGGELTGLKEDLKNIVFNRSGMTPSRMAQKMHEAGYLPDNSGDTLIEALKSGGRGGPQHSAYDLPERAWQMAREAEMGAPPAAQSIPKKVTLREFDALRRDIGAAQRGAALDPERARESAALVKMKQSMDERVNEVVRGDGAADEVLPIAWADALDQARKLKLAEVERFMTGPQASLFRVKDGMPLKQGGEVAGLFWGGRPGLADDVKSFKRLIGENPQMMGQFKSMITTEGASTQTKAGQELSAKFPQWVDQHITGLREALSPQELASVQRIADDIKRALKAGVAGKGPGGTSDTFQLGANALNGGFLDSNAAKLIATKVPYAQGLRSWAAETVGAQKAKNAAALMADPMLLENALMQAPPGRLTNALADPALRQGLYRTAPLIAGGR